MVSEAWRMTIVRKDVSYRSQNDACPRHRGHTTEEKPANCSFRHRDYVCREPVHLGCNFWEDRRWVLASLRIAVMIASLRGFNARAHFSEACSQPFRFSGCSMRARLPHSRQRRPLSHLLPLRRRPHRMAGQRCQVTAFRTSSSPRRSARKISTKWACRSPPSPQTR